MKMLRRNSTSLRHTGQYLIYQLNTAYEYALNIGRVEIYTKLCGKWIDRFALSSRNFDSSTVDRV